MEQSFLRKGSSKVKVLYNYSLQRLHNTDW
jgi:hypothetical protein